jgi:hypothetical protein
MPDLTSAKGKNFVELDLPFGYRAAAGLVAKG